MKLILFITISVICIYSLWFICQIKCIKTTESFELTEYKIDIDRINGLLYNRNSLKIKDNSAFLQEEDEMKQEGLEFLRERKDCEQIIGEWSECSAKCDGINDTVEGTKSRTITIKQRSVNGGKQCPYTPAIEKCSVSECPIDCVGEWTEWTCVGPPCKHPDAEDVQSDIQGRLERQYKVKTQPLRGGAECKKDNKITVVKDGDKEFGETCTIKCPINCQNRTTDGYKNCTASCAGKNGGNAEGTEYKYYEIKRNNANGANKSCYAAGSIADSRRCEIPCPIVFQNCQGYWTPCSKPCGGSQTFNQILPKIGDGATCEAANGQTRNCNAVDCRNGFPAVQGFKIKLRNTNLCLQPNGGSEKPGNGTEIVPQGDCGEFTPLKFKYTDKNSIQQVSSGKCIHPDNRNRDYGTKAHLWDGCDDTEWSGSHRKMLQYTYDPNTGIIKSTSGNYSPYTTQNTYIERYWKFDNVAAGQTLKLQSSGDAFDILL